MAQRILAAVAMSVALLAAGCESKEADEQIGSMKVHLVTPPNFGGNSVVICGDRSADADLKYPCANSFSCTCYDFEPDGQLNVEIPDLCPSKDLPVGEWTFSYTLYTGHCYQGRPTGDVINPLFPLGDLSNPNNFACYDFGNRGAIRVPNRSIERLEPGCNENEIICVTENATKTFDFDVCVQVTPPCDEVPVDGPTVMCPQPPTPAPSLVLDCGCTFNQFHGCLCPDGVLGSSPGILPQLPDYCVFEVEVDSSIDLAVRNPRCLLACGSLPPP